MCRLSSILLYKEAKHLVWLLSRNASSIICKTSRAHKSIYLRAELSPLHSPKVIVCKVRYIWMPGSICRYTSFLCFPFPICFSNWTGKEISFFCSDNTSNSISVSIKGPEFERGFWALSVSIHFIRSDAAPHRFRAGTLYPDSHASKPGKNNKNLAYCYRY